MRYSDAVKRASWGYLKVGGEKTAWLVVVTAQGARYFCNR
jgi:hypothetical protein